MSGITGTFGTDLYRAPETFKRRDNMGKTTKNDVYALAFTLADVLNETPPGETLYGKDLLPVVDIYAVLDVKLSKIVPEFKIPQVCDNNIFEKVSTALKTCLNGEPEKRLCSEELYNVMQEYYTGIEPNLMSPPPKRYEPANERENAKAIEKMNTPSKSQNPLDQKAFLNFETDRYTCRCIDLRVSQATPGILIAFEEEAVIDNTIPEVNTLKLLMQNQTKLNNLKTFEATNACAFYSTLIMDTILLEEDRNMDNAITKAREIILLSQLDFNHKRNVETIYSVDDAIKILKRKLILNLMDYNDLQHGKQMQPKDNDDFLSLLTTFFIQCKEALKNIKHGFFYTVGELIFSFAIDYEEGAARLIDTHQLPHIENAVICHIVLKNNEDGNKERTLAEAMSRLLQKRIYESLGHKTFEVYHQIDLVMQDTTPVNQESFQANVADTTPVNQESFQANVSDTTPVNQESFQANVAEENGPDFPDFNIDMDHVLETELLEYDMDGASQESFMKNDPTLTSTPIKFGLRDYQQDVLREVLNSRDALLVWPTGAGKTHTILSIIEETSGTSIVTTPTLSLMLEYIKQLEKTSIQYSSASSLQSKTADEYIVEICQNRPRCILTTHEQMCKWGAPGLSIINQVRKIDNIIFDEVHTDVLWGTGFRPAMMEIPQLLESIESATRIALTATPVGGNVEKTVQFVKLRDPFLSRRSLFRQNIKLNVYKTREKDEKAKIISSKVSAAKKSLVFTKFIKTATELAQNFAVESDNPVFTFTSEDTIKFKMDTFQDFEQADAGILVATSALGMQKYLQCIFTKSMSKS